MTEKPTMPKQKPAVASPLSMPLDRAATDGSKPKSEPIKQQAATTANRKKDAAKNAEPKNQTANSKPEVTKHKLPFFSTALLILLAPFLFNAGEELYGKLRLWLSTQNPAFAMPPSQKQQPVASIATAAPQVFNPTIQVMVPATEDNSKAITEALQQIAKNEKAIAKAMRGKVVIIHSGAGEGFSLKAEKKKLMTLARIDLDNPVKQSGRIEKINSAELLTELIHSFNRIILNGGFYGVSEMHVKNALSGKRSAIKRLNAIKG